MDQQIEQKIVERGQEFFNSISGEAPSIFNKGWWTGKVMDWSMKNEDFKVQLFRFVDVLPYLNTSESLLRHIREYFASSGSEVPSVLRWGAGKAGLGGALTAKIMGGAIRSNIESMGRQFIIGQNVKEAMGGLAKLRKDGFAFTVDLLGEASVNEEESDAFHAVNGGSNPPGDAKNFNRLQQLSFGVTKIGLQFFLRRPSLEEFLF